MTDETMRLLRVEAPSVGYPEGAELSAITVNPNPAHEAVMLRLPEGIKAEMVLYSSDGREIMHKTTESPTNDIALHGLPAGLYFLKVVTHQGTVWRRIVKR